MSNNQDTRNNNQTILNNQISITKQKSAWQFDYWLLDIGICLLIVSWLLVIISYADDFTYSSKGKRDPFVPLVGPQAMYRTKEVVEITCIEDVSVEGIIYDTKGGSFVIMNGMIVKEGAQAGVVVVENIEPKKVILRIGDNRYEKVVGEEERR